MEQLKQGPEVLSEPDADVSLRSVGVDRVLDLKSVPLLPSAKSPAKARKSDPHGFCVEWQIEPGHPRS